MNALSGWVVLGGGLCVLLVMGWVLIRRRRSTVQLPAHPMRHLEVQLAREEISTDEYHRRRSALGECEATGRHHRRDPVATEDGDR